MKASDFIQLQLTGYDLIEPIGKGGFGQVFLAQKKSTGQHVAVKMLHLNETDEQQQSGQIERFERESRLCADLNHPNIVRLLDKGEADDNYLYSVFEYVDGETLKEFLLRKSSLTPVQAGELMFQILEGLAYAHDRGIVHRDLKPSNIMISTVGNRALVKILDFGIGTFAADIRKADFQTLTLPTETVGTPSYSAPEQLRGDPPTIRSDLYAWGLIFIECLTGNAVMCGSTLAEIFHRQLSPEEVPIPPAMIGHPLADILRRVLQKDQAGRAGDTNQLLSDFQMINLHNLIGRFHAPMTGQVAAGQNSDITEIVTPWPSLQIERRQITILCCALTLLPDNYMSDAEHEVIDALQRDLMRLVSDIGTRYGGYNAGTLGDSVMIYFGYPLAGDNDARHAARTALDIAGQVRRRKTLLASQQGVHPEFRIGLHSGMVTVYKGEPPTGLAPNVAMKLHNIATAGSVLVSDNTRNLLERHLYFERHITCQLTTATPELTYLLTGERQAEAFSFLQSGETYPPMIGRSKEFNTLIRKWECTRDAQSGTVLLRGEPGIGKSRLSYEVNRYIVDKGHASRVIRFLPEHTNNALFEILEMLKTQLDLGETASADKAVHQLENALATCSSPLEWSMPIFCSWLTLPLPEKYTPLSHSPEKQKEILLEALEELLLQHHDTTPFILIVEDLHWADQVSLELLNRLMDCVETRPIMILLTARPEFTPPENSNTFTTIELQRISPADSEALIRSIIKDKVVHYKVLDTVLERTDGVPLFIEEMIRLMLDQQQITCQDGIYALNEAANPALVPGTLQELFNTSLGNLGAAKETVQTAAVIGRKFDYSLLVDVSLRDEALIQSDLELITGSGFVYRQRSVHGDSFTFRHALLRDSAYNSMISQARKSVHERIAVSLESKFQDRVSTDPAGIAMHFARADLFDQAVSYGTQAAGTALSRAVNDEAINQANQVLEWTSMLDTENRQESELTINSILTQAMMGKYGWAAPEVKERIDRSRALLDSMQQSDHLFSSLWALATYHHVAGNRKDVRELTDEMSQIAKLSGDKGLHVAANTFLGLRYQTDGEYGKAAGVLEHAVRNYVPDLHGKHGMTFGLDTRVWSAGTLAIVYWFSGYTAMAEECGDNAVSWAHALNHIPSLGIALLYRGLSHYHAENRGGVLAVTGELLDLAKKYGLPAFEGYASVLHCWARSDPHQAQAILEVLEKMGCRLALSLYGCMLADIEAEQGNLDQAIATLDQYISFGIETDEHLHEPVLYLRRARYLLQKDPAGNQAVDDALVKALQIARAQEMFRIEAAVLEMRIELLGHDDDMSQRVSEIYKLRPELTLI